MKAEAFIDINLLSLPEEERRFVLPLIIKGVHAAIVQELGEKANRQTQLMLGFAPFGLRLFGATPDVIGRATRHPMLHRFREFFSGINPVTEASLDVTLMQRDRRQDKMSPSAQRRREKRGYSASRKDDSRSDMFISMASDSNKQTFAMHMKLSLTPLSEAIGNSYGLAV